MVAEPHLVRLGRIRLSRVLGFVGWVPADQSLGDPLGERISRRGPRTDLGAYLGRQSRGLRRQSPAHLRALGYLTH